MNINNYAELLTFTCFLSSLLYHLVSRCVCTMGNFSYPFLSSEVWVFLHFKGCEALPLTLTEN